MFPLILSGSYLNRDIRLINYIKKMKYQLLNQRFIVLTIRQSYKYIIYCASRV